MGHDKVLAEVGGVPLAARVAAALVDAGAEPVRCIGGDAERLAAAGLAVVPDRHPGEGPLGGVVTALGAHDGPAGIVVVLAGDLATPDPHAVVAVVERLRTHPDAALAVPVVDGRRQWLHAAWRTSAADALRHAFAAGERSIHRAVAGLDVAELVVPTDPDGAGRRAGGPRPAHFGDVDTPEDLARLVRRAGDDELA